MNWLAPLAEHGPSLLVGVTVVLAFGLLAMRVHRSIAQRRWLGVTTALAVVLYLVVGAAPLPRLQLAQFARADVGGVDAASVAAPLAQRADPQRPSLDAAPRTAMLAAALERLTEDVAIPAPPPPPLPETEPTMLASPEPERTRELVPAAMPAVRAPATAPVVEPPPVASVPWPLMLAAAYALGVAFMLVRTLGGHVRLRALLARCAPLSASALRDVELPNGARVCSTDRTVRPFCTGFWRPCIVLPNDLLAPERAGEMHAVLRHEIAHVRARDPRVWSLLAWLAVPLWFHPLFWWLSRDVRFCSEVLADDAAAGTAGRQRYARALIDLAERGAGSAVAAGTVAIFHRPSEFYRRIQMLLSSKAPLSTSTSRVRRFAHVLSMLCLVGAAASAFGVPAPAQEPGRDPLRRENGELRATIDTLREELRQLRDQVAALRQQAATPGAGARDVPVFVDLGGQGNDPVRVQFVDEAARPAPAPQSPSTATKSGRGKQTPKPIDPAKAEDTRRRLYGMRKQRMDEQIAEEQHVAGTPDLPPAALVEPEADSPGVPMLKDLPVLGEMFKPTAMRAYEVQKGDSLARIAKVELGDADRVREIAACNPGLDARKLRPGQKIMVPCAQDPVAAPPDGASPDAFPAPKPPTGASPNAYPSPQPPGDPAFAGSPSGVAAISELTARYLDLVGELEMQRVAVQDAKERFDAGRAPQNELTRAGVLMRTLEKKLMIATRLIEGEIAATESEMQWLDKRRDGCSATERLQLDTEMRRAQARIEALRAVKL